MSRIESLRNPRLFSHSMAPQPLRIKAVMFFIIMLMFTGIMSDAVYADSSDTLTIQIPGTFDTGSTRQMLEDINDLRANNAWYWDETDTEQITVSNLQPLVYDYELERVAMQRAAELAIVYAHTRPNGTRCFTAYTDRLLAGACGENIAYGYTSANAVFTGWAEENEPYSGQGHRRNMLSSSFRSVGIGCYEYDGILFWTQEFSSVVTGADPDPLESVASIEVLKENIEGPAPSQSRIDLMAGEYIDLSEIGLSVEDVNSPRLTVSCVVPEENYSVADTSIAEINEGKLVAVAEGETILSVSAYGVDAEIPVYVRATNEIPLSPGESLSVKIPAGELVYFSFVPAETDEYTFSSSGSYDTYCVLYDHSYESMTYNDDGGDDYNFSLSEELTAGTQYYFGVRMYSPSVSGTITVQLTQGSDIHTDGNFEYKIMDDGTVSITGCCLTGDVTIPASIDGHTVTNLARQLFYGKDNITSVTIPATVTYFGSSSDDNYWDYVFSYCYNLENIYVDGDNPSFCSIDGVLFEKDGKTLINYPCNHKGEVYHVTADLLCCTSFASCQNLKFLFLDNPDTVWYTYTFYNTGSLTTFYQAGGQTAQKVTSEISASREYSVNSEWCRLTDANEIQKLPDNVVEIDTEAFRMTGIRYLSVPDSCRTIAAGAFMGSDLEYISVPGSAGIEAGAFEESVVVEKR